VAHPRELRLYNTLTRRKEAFAPLDPANVRMYVCGPTVYDYAHIGNARPVIVFDVLFRLLQHVYGAEHVTYVRNITDVDDKINARAAQDYPDLPLNEAIRKVTTKTEKQFHADIKALGVLDPTFEPRATDYIRRDDGREDMISLIETLVKRGHAYVAEDHVLFDVASMPDYGKLSNRSLDEMEAGARVEVAPYKKGPMDFVLWKPSKPGEPAWPSPCGIATPGRPGWHIECSAMSGALLGPEFDIHGGGIDLTFPHHENEIAQSRCAHGTPCMAKVWMHNGFLQVEGEKMSKSLGNFVTIHELLASKKFGGRSWPGAVLRLAMLKTHYRQPIDWTATALNEALNELRGWYNLLLNAARNHSVQPAEELISALADDLNTPQALAVLRNLSSRARTDDRWLAPFMGSLEFLGLWKVEHASVLNNYHVRKGPTLIPSKLLPELEEVQVAVANNLIDRRNQLIGDLNAKGVQVSIFGSGGLSYEVRVQAGISTDAVNEKIKARLAARKAKDFKEADRIRDELAAMGIALKDAKDPATGEIVTTWEVAR
jgi:cysteinyl-tRNA synthetase